MRSALPSRQAILVRGAIASVLKPRLTAGTSLMALDAALADVHADTWARERPKVEARVKQAFASKLTGGATLDDLPTFLGAMDAEEDDEDDLEGEDEEMDDSEREDERKKRADDRKKGMDAAARKTARDGRRTARDSKRAARDAKAKAAKDTAKPAKDEAGETEAEKAAREKKERAEAAEDTKRAVDQAMDSLRADMRAATQAREDVRPLIGAVSMAMDSAPDIYKMALDHLNVDLTGVPKEGYGALLRAFPKPRAPGNEMAMDIAFTTTSTRLAEKFPALAHIRRA